MGSQSLAHIKWNCKYHVVFAPKYRLQEIYAHLIQAEFGVPVYDAITLIRYAKTTVTHTPYYGFL